MYRKISILLFICVFGSTLNAQTTPAKEITVESIWKTYDFYAKGFPGFKGMKDGEHFTKITLTGTSWAVTKHAFSNYSGQGETILTEKDMLYAGKAISMEEYEFNNDETKMLITTNIASIYRRSYSADFFIFDLATRKLTPLDENRPGANLAEFSPDGNQVAYAHGNNLFIKNLKTNKIIQVTKDGSTNAVINGTTDWVYEEEFAITKAFMWSPDSKQLAFLRFDESKVKEFELAFYGQLYPQIYKYKYPKAGEDNSKVTAHLYKVGGKSVQLNLGEYEYIPRLKWANTSNKLVIQTLNRHQNHVRYHLIDASGKSLVQKVFFEEKSATYIEIDDNLLILKDEKSLLRTSEASGYMHIHRIGFDGSNQQITTGNWDVIEFLGVNEEKQMIYYTSAEKGAIHKGIYRVSLTDLSKKALSPETGSHDAEFSEGMKYFVKTSSDANTPNIIMLCDAEGTEIAVLEDNQKLKDKLATYQLSKKEFMTIQGADGPLNAWMIKPANFDPNKKYPVYINIYGGPGHNTVADRYEGNDYMFHQLLAQKGYIVFSVDPHGTYYRGAKFKKSTYLQMGKLEVEDFISAAKELGKMSFIDKDRIGIQGWSYGGFMTSLAMTKGAAYFKMGIAVAPVTNWRYYDNIYTERFMRTPAENASGYDDNSPINFVKDIKGKYLLVHGSADDNVHYQNTMEMITALTNANIQFDLFIYPNKDHGIYGGNTRNHLFNMLLNYTLKNL
jgi:dipeptidyl-peptidase-4